MKSILISIKPKWVAKILNGEKTVEIRKTMPKCDLPIQVYIYCCKPRKNEIGCHINYERVEGKVVAKFTLNKVERFINGCNSRYLDCGASSFQDYEYILKPSCLTENELYDYCEDLSFYAWHIDNLVIFDKPKELGEFEHEVAIRDNCRGYIYEIKKVSRPPQSYMFIESEEKE